MSDSHAKAVGKETSTLPVRKGVSGSWRESGSAVSGELKPKSGANAVDRLGKLRPHCFCYLRHFQILNHASRTPAMGP